MGSSADELSFQQAFERLHDANRVNPEDITQIRKGIEVIYKQNKRLKTQGEASEQALNDLKKEVGSLRQRLTSNQHQVKLMGDELEKTKDWHVSNANKNLIQGIGMGSVFGAVLALVIVFFLR